MPNKIKTSGTTTKPVATRNGNFKIGVDGSGDYGPTSITGFYNGITPPVGGYTIYSHKESDGPSINVANDDDACIFFLRALGATGSTINEVLSWSTGRTDVWVQTSDLTAIDLDSLGVTFSQTFIGGASPGTTIENDWTTFRSQLTGTYTTFTFTSSLSGSTSYTVTDAVKVQLLANGLRDGTPTTQTIGVNTWLVGCCACRAGGSNPLAVEFSNVASCSASSTAALRPWIANSNWGGFGSTVNAPTQTLTLTFS